MRLLSLHGRCEYFDGSIMCIFVKMNSWYLVCEDGIYAVYNVCAQQDFFCFTDFFAIQFINEHTYFCGRSKSLLF
jgi:hypothetical protein